MNYKNQLIVIPILILISLLAFLLFTNGKKSENTAGLENLAQGWCKSDKTPLVIFQGDLSQAPKNCINSPVVLNIDSCPYKNYKWAFIHLATDTGTYENYLSISFSTSDGFKIDQWDDELKITGKLVEPFEVKIIDGKIYLWGSWQDGHEYKSNLCVMTSDNWSDWSSPVTTIKNDHSWKSNRIRGFSVEKILGEDNYIAIFSGQSENNNGVFSMGRAFASKERLIKNEWVEDPDNPVFTSQNISWNGKDVVLYPDLLPQYSNGQWMMAMATYLKEPHRFAIGFAYSIDNGKHWKEYHPGENPVLNPGPKAWDAGYVSTPYIIETGIRSYKMYYGARPEIMKYHAIGIACLGQQSESEKYAAVAFNRQISWGNFKLKNIEIGDAYPYEKDLDDELVQKDVKEGCVVLTPVIDLGKEKFLKGGKKGTKIFANKIEGLEVELIGSNQAPTENLQTEYRKGYNWYSGWGKTMPVTFKCSLKKGTLPDEFYISEALRYHYIQMKISVSERNNPLIIDQILFCSE